MKTIELCGRRVPVVAQKHATLRRRLSGEDFQKVMTAEYSHESYRILCVLIPAIDPKVPKSREMGTTIPEWEWDGFTTEESWLDYKNTGKDLEYDPEYEDPSPSTEEIVNAFETALMESGANRLGKLLNIVTSVGNLASLSDTQTQDSPASPGTNGASTSIPSGVSPLT
jgi:hypothetical protein